jgi:NADH-quinone oxidoreductase subunit E
MSFFKENEITRIVEKAVEKHGKTREALLPILTEVNNELGYIPQEALAEIRRQVHEPDQGLFLSDSQLFSISSFYHMLSLRPLGKHVVRFCESAPCHVMGGRQVIKAIEEALNLRPGETSPDGEWSLITTSCLGLCSVGPVFYVDDDLYGNISPDLVREILGRYDGNEKR